ncbi:DgyrCDS8474 [Dimorphilus gyrociliatus]|uniref:DgyrCDS8474 n=1 Tax=Dimorphilus gyrociliatus TaxID=2664684 RepID=A0A7I8VWK2_9ANNE|nr:DgyrCDS8474 [Dimorphilus gyrociliatus]
MFSWLNHNDNRKQHLDIFESVTPGLKHCYFKKLKPLEEAYKYYDFHQPSLEEADFEAKPMILLVGQYSTGKTSFIRHLLEEDFPGMRIGPEPTTDKFIILTGGSQKSIIPGNALVVDTSKQFRQLSKFGNHFLTRLQCSILENKVLDSLTIVDTPGILSGEKQTLDRGYDFGAVIEWFAERVDRIILLFDAHKLDISDELRIVIESIKRYEEKVRIVLNKADMVDSQQLMRVYGALMWSLGKVLSTPEVARVYIGSFWAQPLKFDENRHIFEKEANDLFNDLQCLPSHAAVRKVNDLIKRARLAKVHAYIIAYLKREMPRFLGKEKKKRELIKKLGDIFNKIQHQKTIPHGDLPDIDRFRRNLQFQDFTKFKLLKEKLIDDTEYMLSNDISKLMKLIPHEEKKYKKSEASVKGGAFENVKGSPFNIGYGEGVDKGRGTGSWIVENKKPEYMKLFQSLNPVNGKLNASVARDELTKSQLTGHVLSKIWKLSDVDKDGMLDGDEFCLAVHLVDVAKKGYELPTKLPGHLIPPGKLVCK